VVQSTSATSAVFESLYSSISLSQSGFSFLQWPHQGARNLMNTVFPAVSLAQVSGVSSMAPATASRLRSREHFINEFCLSARNRFSAQSYNL